MTRSTLRDGSALLAAAFILLFVGAIACDTARDADAPETGARVEDIGATDAEETGELGTADAPEGAALSSAEIEKVVSTVNQAEIDAGELAVQKASNPEVKQFAQRMINEHKGLEQQSKAETTETPSDPNALSSQLKTQAQQQMQTLQTVSGAEFDRAYIDGQVQMHQQVLDTIENRLLPSAEDPEVRNLLETARTSVQEHLESAQEIQGNLQQA